MLEYDVLIVGGGLAGLRAAVELCDKYEVALLSKVHPTRSHSIAAQGGINAALGNSPDGTDDTVQKHAFDTIKGSDYLADQKAVEIMCREAPNIVYEMEHWGCPFSRFPDGSIAQRPFGGAGFPRTCYSADITGHVLLNTLFEQATSKNVKVYQEWYIIALVIDNGRCHGVIAFDFTHGSVIPIMARTVLFATGGYGRVYRNSTNALINTGSGIGMAYAAKAPIKDMEFVQFHPTGLIGTNILISEACRGEGGILLNNRNERFMERYAPAAMELAPRDITARSTQTEIDEGRGLDHPLGTYIKLDLRHLGKDKILQRLPGIRKICIDFIGIDPVEEPIPIMPCQHYSMGGIDTDERGATEIAGFYAAGECACVSVHGANRLGGNSLLETIVFGKLAGRAIAEYLSSDPARPDKKPLEAAGDGMEQKIIALCRDGRERSFSIQEELATTMSRKVGIFRTKTELQGALEDIARLKEQYQQVHVACTGRHMNYELMNAIELGYMLEVAHVIALGACQREESRGAHFRRDFPGRDDTAWLKHSIARIGVDGWPLMGSKEVVITEHQPLERTY